VPAATLAYDNLPPHSTLLREYSDDGITITAQAQEPDKHVRWRVRRRAAASAAWVCAAAIALGLIIFGQQTYEHRHLLPRWTSILAGVFGAALFGFIWHVRYLALLDATTLALSQNTIIAAQGDRLLIETSGPLGKQSVEYARDQIRRIRIIKNFRRSKWGEEQPLDCLRIIHQDGGQMNVLIGRDRAELRWAQRELESRLHKVND
jgi:hypothetical protein